MGVSSKTAPVRQTLMALMPLATATPSNCSAYKNNTYGFTFTSAGGVDCVITKCSATANGGAGIFTGDGAKISHCTASGNTGNSGILVGNYALIDHCDVRGNGSHGIGCFVFSVMGATTAIDCVIT